MRIALLVVGTVTAGVWGVGANNGIIPDPNQMLQAVMGLGGDASKVTRIVSLNPLQTYNNVMRQVTTGGGGVPTGFQGTPVVVPPDGFRGMNGLNNLPNISNGFDSQAVSQIQQNNRRMEDMAAFARNPAGWHGMPPH